MGLALIYPIALGLLGTVAPPPQAKSSIASREITAKYFHDPRTAAADNVDIAVQDAYDQIPGIAAARGLRRDAVRGVVEGYINARLAESLGTKRIKVAELNRALDVLK